MHINLRSSDHATHTRLTIHDNLPGSYLLLGVFCSLNLLVKFIVELDNFFLHGFNLFGLSSSLSLKRIILGFDFVQGLNFGLSLGQPLLKRLVG